MTLPQRPPLDEQVKGRKSFLQDVPHQVILTKVIDHLRAPEQAPDSLEVR
ncbi:hypothetical protein [Nocardia brevicatena]|nr:hypothetical protein [Nocardia brevicatena]